MPSAEQELTQKVENQALPPLFPMETTINVRAEAPEIPGQRESAGNRFLETYRKTVRELIKHFGSNLEALKLSLQDSAEIIETTSLRSVSKEAFIAIANEEIRKVYES